MKAVETGSSCVKEILIVQINPNRFKPFKTVQTGSNHLKVDKTGLKPYPDRLDQTGTDRSKPDETGLMH